MREQYLGDGVYGTFDDGTVTLDLRGQDDTTVIVLEPDVLKALAHFIMENSNAQSDG